MFRADREGESLGKVMDISEICNRHQHMDAFLVSCLKSISKQIKMLQQYLAFTGADTHMAVLSVEGVSEQPQTLMKNRIKNILDPFYQAKKKIY